MRGDELIDNEVPLDAIRRKAGTQSRAAVNEDAVAEYSEAIK